MHRCWSCWQPQAGRLRTGRAPGTGLCRHGTALAGRPANRGRGRWALAPQSGKRACCRTLGLRPTDSVLEIGTGSGCGRFAPPRPTGPREIVPRTPCKRVKIWPVSPRWKSAKPTVLTFNRRVIPCYDAIVPAGSVAEIPHALLAMLKIGGRPERHRGRRTRHARHAGNPHQRHRLPRRAGLGLLRSAPGPFHRTIPVSSSQDSRSQHTVVMQIRPRDLPQWLEQAPRWANRWY